MKIIKKFLPILTAPIFPILFLSSCSQTTDESPVRLETTVYKTKNKNAFNNIFNLLNTQNGTDSFISKSTEQINQYISDEITSNSLIQEKLRLYFFNSIYQSLSNISDLIDNEITPIILAGEREIGVNAIKKLIDDAIKTDENNSNKYETLEKELNKIIDMKIELSYKKVDELPFQWTWKTSFKLAEDSELKKILKLQNTGIDSSIFYKRSAITEEELEEAIAASNGDAVKLEALKVQLKYQSSKWYWDQKEQTLTSIEKESNTNPYSTNGTSGGFTATDIKRTEFAIDFEQHPSNILLYKPVFLFQTSGDISNIYINSAWSDYLVFKGFKKVSGEDETEQVIKNTKDITIDLKSDYVEYDKKV